jgi:undecaprenyl diphosphate synthase
LKNLKKENCPKHVAIVMDGNGRWAKKRLLPRSAGHKVGGEVAKKVVQLALDYELEVLTLFAFSSENWSRPKQEVQQLMDLMLSGLESEMGKLAENGIAVRFIGQRDRFSAAIVQQFQRVEELSRHNTRLVLVIAFDYGGRWDICQAASKVAADVKEGRLDVHALDEEVFHRYTCLSDLSPPDLFIRTSGEQRISNFMLWQFAYTELYFSEVLWPDFSEKTFQDALQFFATRKRRFGKTQEQSVESR